MCSIWTYTITTVIRQLQTPRSCGVGLVQYYLTEAYCSNFVIHLQSSPQAGNFHSKRWFCHGKPKYACGWWAANISLIRVIKRAERWLKLNHFFTVPIITLNVGQTKCVVSNMLRQFVIERHDLTCKIFWFSKCACDLGSMCVLYTFLMHLICVLVDGKTSWRI